MARQSNESAVPYVLNVVRFALAERKTNHSKPELPCCRVLKTTLT